MGNRQRGDYFERQTRDALAGCGWYVVRSAGSLGVADLVALRQGRRPLLVSCKLSGRIDPTERADLVAAALMAGARPMVAQRSRPGWVAVSTVPTSGRPIVIDELKVPRRVARDA
jgi:Holliday junction resolvase